MLTFVAQPHHPFRLGDFLRNGFQEAKWTHFRAAIAFVKNSGVQYIKADLAQFRIKGDVNISVGIDHGGSSVEGLMQLVDAVGAKGKLWVYKNSSNTFHPKLYLFKNAAKADILIGSGNMTKGGLFENTEAGVRICLDLSHGPEALFLKSIEETLDLWSTKKPGICLPLDAAMVTLLHGSGEVPTEAEAVAATKMAAGSFKPSKGSKASLFKSQPIPSAPPAPSKKASGPAKSPIEVAPQI